MAEVLQLPSRFLPIDKVAELFGYTGDPRDTRRRAMRRMRELERRDGQTYVFKPGGAPNSPAFVSLDALERLAPWSQDGLKAVMQRLEKFEHRFKAHSAQLKAHASRIKHVEENQAADRKLLDAISEWQCSRVSQK